MSGIKAGDRIRRTVSCGESSCEFPLHQVGWGGTVGEVLKNGFVVDGYPISREDVEKVEGEVTPEARPYLSAAPDPAIRLEVLKLALSYGAHDLTAKKIVEVADEFAAWVEGR